MPAPSTAPAPIYDRLVDEHGDVLADAREAAHKAERTAEGVLDFGHGEAPQAQQAPQAPQSLQDQQAPQAAAPEQAQAPQGQQDPQGQQTPQNPQAPQDQHAPQGQHAPGAQQAPHFPQDFQAQQPPAPTQEG